MQTRVGAECLIPLEQGKPLPVRGVEKLHDSNCSNKEGTAEGNWR